MRLPNFRDLSIEQDKIYNLPLTTNYLVTGPPGTGKTVIALYRASMYAKLKKKPILLALSKLLTSYTNGAARELSIAGSILTYHSWVFTTYRDKFKVSPPEIDRFVYDWGQMTPKLIMASTADNAKPCLLIDEGQDLPPDFYTAVSFMADQLTVFADENQRISSTQSTFADIRSRGNIKNEHKLTRNYRNSKEIAEVAAYFYAGLPTGKPDLPDRRGNLPVIKQTPNLDAAIEFITTFEKNNAHLQIGIFTKGHALQGLIQKKLAAVSTKNPVQAYQSGKDDMPNFDSPGIKLVQFQSAKGLEFDAVFIPEINQLQLDLESLDTKMMFYVLLSRAREHLFITYSGSDKPKLLNLFPEELVEWRK
jgi:DNA helicase IV